MYPRSRTAATRHTRVTLTACLTLALTLLAPLSVGQTTAENHKKAVAQAISAAEAAMVHGPASVALKNQAHLALPEHYGFVPQQEAAAFLTAMGGATDNTFIGLITPTDRDNDGWMMTVRYEAAGYVKDDDAKHWDADKLLDTLKEGTEAGNAHRIEIGAQPIKVTRWIAPPAYDAPTHRLVWAAEVVNKEGHDDDPGVNYNTYLLGREGYISLDLITSLAAVEKDKPAAHQILGMIAYEKGKSYDEFNSSTDKVAAYGLAALIAGVAAKKLGLLALLGVAIVKYAKLLLIIVGAAIAGARKWFKRRPKGGASEVPAGTTAAPPVAASEPPPQTGEPPP